MKRINILGNIYETNFPTVGQMIDIKRLEMNLSGNRIPQLIQSGLVEDAEIVLDIKAVSTMSVLFPKLLDDLKTQSLLDLQYDDFEVVFEVYMKEIFPWLNEWKKSIRERQSLDSQIKAADDEQDIIKGNG